MFKPCVRLWETLFQKRKPTFPLRSPCIVTVLHILFGPPLNTCHSDVLLRGCLLHATFSVAHEDSTFAMSGSWGGGEGGVGGSDSLGWYARKKISRCSHYHFGQYTRFLDSPGSRE